MSMRSKIARLFTIKTRLEAFLVTYAIAVGSVERGINYAQSYPGNGGILLAMACLGVPFIAGAKLLDSVRPDMAPARAAGGTAKTPPRRISRNRPKDRRSVLGSALPRSRRTD
jgi:hypothetical protein